MGAVRMGAGGRGDGGCWGAGKGRAGGQGVGGQEVAGERVCGGEGVKAGCKGVGELDSRSSADRGGLGTRGWSIQPCMYDLQAGGEALIDTRHPH